MPLGLLVGLVVLGCGFAGGSFGVVTLEPDFALDGAGRNVDSIAFWEAADPAETLMFVTSKASRLVEVWVYPFEGRQRPPLSHASFGGGASVQVNGVAVDQETDRLYVAVSDPTSTVSVFSLPDRQFQFEFIRGAVDLKREPNLGLLEPKDGPRRVYVTADDVVYVHDASDGARIGRFQPHRGLETLAVDAHRGLLLIPDEGSGSGVHVYDVDGHQAELAGEHVFGGDDVFQSDAEGIVVYACRDAGGADRGSGFVVVADQRRSVTDFEIFDRATGRHLGVLQLEGVSNTDGIASTQRPLPDYPEGLFAAIDDDTRTVGVGWDRILAATGLSCP
jgi:DNA-binding beta-propeller fold protein YncE